MQHNHSTTKQHIIEQQKLPNQGMVKDHLLCCLVKIMFLKEGQPMLPEECDNVAEGKYIPKKITLLKVMRLPYATQLMILNHSFTQIACGRPYFFFSNESNLRRKYVCKKFWIQIIQHIKKGTTTIKWIKYNNFMTR